VRTSGFLVLVLALSASTACLGGDGTTAVLERVPETDYAVYRAVLDSLFELPVEHRGHVATAITTSRRTKPPWRSSTRASVLARVSSTSDQRVVDSLDQHLRQSFADNNRDAYALDETLLPESIEATADELFIPGEDNWPRIWRDHPHIWGAMQFSRVGYSADGSQALVEIGFVQAAMAGEGRLYHLVLSAGRWVVRGSWLTWVA
jgi:hypothetical protein